MSQIAQLSAGVEGLFDFVFDPQQINGNVASFMDTTTGIPAQFPKLTASLVRSSKKSRNNRVRVRLEVPVVQTVGGVTTYQHTNFADITFTTHENATLAERQAVVQGIALLLATPELVALSENLEMLY